MAVVEVELVRIFIRELNDCQLIELREVGGEERSFPIIIGLPEAQAIERRFQGIEPPRPQTHDLLAQTIEAMGGTVVSVTIGDLADHTFYATLDIDTGKGGPVRVDARPSDAIAVAVAIGVSIYVEEHVVEAAAHDASA